MNTWDEFEKECKSCTACLLHETRNNVVIGVGNRNADILIVGEGPGENEDLKAEPFVGRAGMLLDDMLAIINLSRKENVYISNIVKCRPPNNRDPLPAERDACIKWLNHQIRLIAPKIIICLGRIAAVTLIDPDIKITRDHGKWYEKDNIMYIALYHPAALLRDPHKRPDTFADLKTISQMLEL